MEFPDPPYDLIEKYAHGQEPFPGPPSMNDIEEYVSFGLTYLMADPCEPISSKSDQTLSTLEENIRSMRAERHCSADEVDMNECKKELHRCNHSLIACYLDLLEMISKNCEQAVIDGCLENIINVTAKAIETLNMLREAQAYECAIILLKSQTYQRRHMSTIIDRHLNDIVTDINQRIVKLKQEPSSENLKEGKKKAQQIIQSMLHIINDFKTKVDFDDEGSQETLMIDESASNINNTPQSE